jgi:hypothetical protein
MVIEEEGDEDDHEGAEVLEGGVKHEFELFPDLVQVEDDSDFEIEEGNRIFAVTIHLDEISQSIRATSTVSQ